MIDDNMEQALDEFLEKEAYDKAADLVSDTMYTLAAAAFRAGFQAAYDLIPPEYLVTPPKPLDEIKP